MVERSLKTQFIYRSPPELFCSHLTVFKLITVLGRGEGGLGLEFLMFGAASVAFYIPLQDCSPRFLGTR